MAKYVCTACGYVYDPEQGDFDSGIRPVHLLRNCLMTGFVLSVALLNECL